MVAGFLYRDGYARSGPRSPPTLGTRSELNIVVDRQVRLFLVGLLVVSVPSLAVQFYAQPPAVSSPQPPWAQEYFEQFESAATTYNHRIDDLYRVQIWGLDLRQARSILQNERVNVYITGRSGKTGAFSFRLDEEAKIRDVSRELRFDATVRVIAERSAIRRISKEYTQTRAVRAAYLGGDIRVTGVGVAKFVEWWLIDHWVQDTVSGDET